MKFNFKRAILGGLIGLAIPYLTIILLFGVLIWDWNFVFREIIRKAFLVRLSIFTGIITFLIVIFDLINLGEKR